MGILNVTPDSFSDGGRYHSLNHGVEQALAMIEQGADILDVGGESTRPGAHAVSVEEELDRVIPIIEALSADISVPISIDTSKPEVMRAAVKAGAGMVNDVSALSTSNAMAVVAELDVPVCLMHMQGEPRTMQSSPVYADVVEDVVDYLAERIALCERSGIAHKNLLVDPGFGFGKTLQHNLKLLAKLERMLVLGVPILSGISRKSMLGAITGKPVDDRVCASVVAAVISVQNGASIVRVHDVAETVDALRILSAVDAV